MTRAASSRCGLTGIFLSGNGGAMRKAEMVRENCQTANCVCTSKETPCDAVKIKTHIVCSRQRARPRRRGRARFLLTNKAEVNANGGGMTEPHSTIAYTPASRSG